MGLPVPLVSVTYLHSWFAFLVGYIYSIVQYILLSFGPFFHCIFLVYFYQDILICYLTEFPRALIIGFIV